MRSRWLSLSLRWSERLWQGERAWVVVEERKKVGGERVKGNGDGWTGEREQTAQKENIGAPVVKG